MNPRNSRPARARTSIAPIHRGPQAMPAASVGTALHHAPNAALLIDFDNVTMGIQKDLHTELRNLLSSDIIQGKVAVQRAYADWRRYPQYIVPLAESSIDTIMAPAYGSSKKNATDIRLAVDAIELVFTRPEIGTFILLSGDSDFASLVMKLKEYGKYVIGVGIRESSSDLLVMNCDEYYSYNALAGLVKSNEEEQVKRDPWELVVEALQRMRKNSDVMRSDRLKQVMQELDPSFDEKDLGMSKFSRFVQEAQQRGLVRLTRLENGQLEVDLADGAESGRPRAAEPPSRAELARGKGSEPAVGEDGRPAAEDRGRGRGRGRGRDRDRGRDRGRDADGRRPPEQVVGEREPSAAERTPEPEAQRELQLARGPAQATPAEPEMAGERVTREEAFSLVRRAVSDLARDGDAVRASAVRQRARELLGRDSESLTERNFARILRDAHDADVVDLRRSGDDYEVAPAAEVAPIAAQLELAEPQPSQSQAGRSAATAAALRRGIRHRGGGRGGRPSTLPPELLSIGIVDDTPPIAPARDVSVPAAPSVHQRIIAPAESLAPPATDAAPEKPARRGRGRAVKAAAPRGRGGRKTAAKGASDRTAAADSQVSEKPPVTKPRQARPRKRSAAGSETGE